MDDRTQVDRLIRRWFLIIVGVSFGILVILRISLKVEDFPLHWLIRGAGIIGYLSVLLTCLSSAYMREITIYLGTPFIKVHHGVAVAGLVMHWLNYIAFWLSTSHALLIGTTFRHGIIRLVSLSMALGLMILFVWKRLQQRRLKANTVSQAATALGRQSATR